MCSQLANVAPQECVMVLELVKLLEKQTGLKPHPLTDILDGLLAGTTPEPSLQALVCQPRLLDLLQGSRYLAYCRWRRLGECKIQDLKAEKFSEMVATIDPKQLSKEEAEELGFLLSVHGYTNAELVHFIVSEGPTQAWLFCNLPPLQIQTTRRFPQPRMSSRTGDCPWRPFPCAVNPSNPPVGG